MGKEIKKVMISVPSKSIIYKGFGMLFIGMLLWPCVAAADMHALDADTTEYSLTDKAPKAVHKVIVHLGRQCCAEFELSTQVGYLMNGVCQYQQETPKHVVSDCDVFPYGVFFLNGQRLEQLVGNQWTCAATHLHTFSFDKFDRFILVANKQHHYINTVPTSGSILLPLC